MSNTNTDTTISPSNKRKRGGSNNSTLNKTQDVTQNTTDNVPNPKKRKENKINRMNSKSHREKERRMIISSLFGKLKGELKMKAHPVPDFISILNYTIEFVKRHQAADEHVKQQQEEEVERMMYAKQQQKVQQQQRRVQQVHHQRMQQQTQQTQRGVGFQTQTAEQSFNLPVLEKELYLSKVAAMASNEPAGAAYDYEDQYSDNSSYSNSLTSSPYDSSSTSSSSFSLPRQNSSNSTGVYKQTNNTNGQGSFEGVSAADHQFNQLQNDFLSFGRESGSNSFDNAFSEMFML